MSATSIQQQRDYYQRTAEHYDAMHVSGNDEHAIALAIFSGYARMKNVQTILDVGAGTGRATDMLQRLLPDAKVLGVEPVQALREVGHARGIPETQLVSGDALALPFADDSFDFVIETGVLHHIPEPEKAVREMLRVARLGVMISDSNKLGQGSRLARALKAVIDRLGLWKLMIWLTTKGKMSKYSDGDGVFFSYSVYDNLAVVRTKFPCTHFFNTVEMPGTSIKHGAAQAALIAVKAESAT